jgi:hypothetical protein
MTADSRFQSLQHVLALARQGLPSPAAQQEFDDAIALIKYNETVRYPAYPDKSSWLEVAKDKCASYASSDTAAANAGLSTRALSHEEAVNRKLDPEMVASMAVAQDYKCFCCGVVMRMRWHTQHHPLAFSVGRVFNDLPHIAGNCVLVCIGCNRGDNEAKRAKELVGDEAFGRLHEMLKYPDTRRLVWSLSFWRPDHGARDLHYVQRVEEYVKANEHGPVNFELPTLETSTLSTQAEDQTTPHCDAASQLDQSKPNVSKKRKYREQDEGAEASKGDNVDSLFQTSSQGNTKTEQETTWEKETRGAECWREADAVHPFTDEQSGTRVQASQLWCVAVKSPSMPCTVNFLQSKYTYILNVLVFELQKAGFGHQVKQLPADFIPLYQLPPHARQKGVVNLTALALLASSYLSTSTDVDSLQKPTEGAMVRAMTAFLRQFPPIVISRRQVLIDDDGQHKWTKMTLVEFNV